MVTLHGLADEWQAHLQRDSRAVQQRVARVLSWESSLLAAEADVDAVVRRIEHLELMQRDTAEDAEAARARHTALHHALREVEGRIDLLHDATGAPNSGGPGGGSLAAAPSRADIDALAEGLERTLAPLAAQLKQLSAQFGEVGSASSHYGWAPDSPEASLAVRLERAERELRGRRAHTARLQQQLRGIVQRLGSEKRGAAHAS
eukprot:g3274.t1